mmetsp:Transcript_21939/g.51595  ORF Transcript_21939/g.51595 Transcript_21939/m.51595 type:complete len:219 (-) Transcript_21939:612-1268(-)
MPWLAQQHSLPRRNLPRPPPLLPRTNDEVAASHALDPSRSIVAPNRRASQPRHREAKSHHRLLEAAPSPRVAPPLPANPQLVPNSKPPHKFPARLKSPPLPFNAFCEVGTPETLLTASLISNINSTTAPTSIDKPCKMFEPPRPKRNSTNTKNGSATSPPYHPRPSNARRNNNLTIPNALWNNCGGRTRGFATRTAKSPWRFATCALKTNGWAAATSK